MTQSMNTQTPGAIEKCIKNAIALAISFGVLCFGLWILTQPHLAVELHSGRTRPMSPLVNWSFAATCVGGAFYLAWPIVAELRSNWAKRRR